MASPPRASGPSTARTTRIVGREATTRSRGSTSRLTRSQLAKLAREECEKLMGAVSSIYSPAELEGSKQKEVLEFEPDRLLEGDPQRPEPPDASAPLEDFQEVRLLDGLGGVLNSGRGKIDNWLENLKTRDRREHLEEIDEWFNQFQDRGPELASFFQKCETEVEQGRVLCQRSENLVNKLAQDAVHTRQEVTEFVDHKLKPMAGGGQGGMVHAIEKKRLLAQIHQDHARLAQEAIEEQIQEIDSAIEQAKKDFYDHRLSRMRMQQAERDDITDLQNDIEKRNEALTKLNEEVEQKAQEAHNMESFVKFGRKCVKEGRPIDSKDPDLDALAEKYRDYALSRKRHIRTVVCQRIDQIEKQEQEDRNAVAILRDWTQEANAEANTKETVMEMAAAEQKKQPQVSGQDAEEGKHNEAEFLTQTRIKEELIKALKNIRFEKGRIENATQRRKVILDAISQSEDIRNEVRRQLRRAMAKIMQYLSEEEEKLRHVIGMPQLLPSTWRGKLQREWIAEVKPVAELYAHVLFASRLAGSTEEDAGRTRRSENAERLKDLVENAEALWEDLQDLELKLTPAGVDAKQADLLAEAGWEDLEESRLLGKERVNQHRLDDLRSLEQEMFEQARKVVAELTAESCVLEGVNMAEILRLQMKNPKKLVRKGTSKKLN